MSTFKKYFYRNIGKKIRYYREKNGLTQEKLAEILNYNEKYIGHVERCERYISNIALVKLLELWQIQPEDFYKFETKYPFEGEQKE